MDELGLFNDDDWERFCSPENDSSITTDLEQVEYIEIFLIRISANPPRSLLEIALTRLSQTIKFFTHLSCIQLDGIQKDLDPRLLSTVCGALLHSSTQQKIKVKFNFGTTSIDDNFLPVANLMKNCKREVVFCIEGGPILGDETWALFADGVRNLSGAVKELTLGSIDVGDDGACALAENLKVSTTLTCLDLSYNAIEVEGANELAGALKQNGALSTLNLSYNLIGDDGAEALASALKQNETLTELGLSRNYIGEDGAKALAGALKENGALIKLDLSCNSIGGEGAKVLACALKQNETLTKLDLSCNSIGGEGAEALACALKQNETLTKLDLSENSIGGEGANALAGGLKQNGTLTKLDLSENSIGDEGAKALARALKQNGALIKLDLSENSIGDDGAEALAGAVKENGALMIKLDLSWNSIGDDGAEALARALKQNGALTELDLSGNSIGDEGAIALGEAIAYNVTLDSLDLRDNDEITEKVGIEALVNGLNRNSTLIQSDLSYYHGGIAFALRRNKALLKEAAWMERFSDQDIVLKSKMLSNAMERYSMSDFRELTFLFLQRERATLLTQAESVIESGGPAPKKRRV